MEYKRCAQHGVDNALDALQTHDTLPSVAALVDSVGEGQPGRMESIGESWILCVVTASAY